jgi:hypothetical protein
MEKAIFNYTKEGETTPSNRVLIKPKFLKEATNALKDFEKTDVKYVRGYELNKADLTEEQVRQYEQALEDYEDSYPTLQEFLTDKGLDYARLQEKSFKKEKISGFRLID